MQDRLYRVLDVNFNRLREGLRVVEEYCRLVCDDGLALQVKGLRHDLRLLLDDKLALACLEARQAETDVGRQSFTDTEACREDWQAILQANLKRAQEAARVIEECAKLDDTYAKLSQGIKGLRFALYELEKKVLNRRSTLIREWFAGGDEKAATLYLVVDEEFYTGSDLLADVQAILKAGIGFLQWRQKRGSDDYFLKQALKIRALCLEFKTPFVVNDRPDIAILTDADILHLGQDDLPIAAARCLVGEQMPIGRSTHSLEQALKAVADGADYLGFGPIYTTPSKRKPDPEVGLAGLREMLAQVSLPVVAIGGLNETNVVSAAATKVPAVAVIRSILQSENPAAQVATLKDLLHY
ncbi:thiamine phosphate synthase [bacterium]|nr:thiamine phosphate synthase [bacterium]